MLTDIPPVESKCVQLASAFLKRQLASYPDGVPIPISYATREPLGATTVVFSFQWHVASVPAEFEELPCETLGAVNTGDAFSLAHLAATSSPTSRIGAHFSPDVGAFSFLPPQPRGDSSGQAFKHSWQRVLVRRIPKLPLTRQLDGTFPLNDFFHRYHWAEEDANAATLLPESCVDTAANGFYRSSVVKGKEVTQVWLPCTVLGRLTTAAYYDVLVPAKPSGDEVGGGVAPEGWHSLPSRAPHSWTAVENNTDHTRSMVRRLPGVAVILPGESEETFGESLGKARDYRVIYDRRLRTHLFILQTIAGEATNIPMDSLRRIVQRGTLGISPLMQSEVERVVADVKEEHRYAAGKAVFEYMCLSKVFVQLIRPLDLFYEPPPDFHVLNPKPVACDKEVSKVPRNFTGRVKTLALSIGAMPLYRCGLNQCLKELRQIWGSSYGSLILLDIRSRGAMSSTVQAVSAPAFLSRLSQCCSSALAKVRMQYYTDMELCLMRAVPEASSARMVDPQFYSNSSLPSVFRALHVHLQGCIYLWFREELEAFCGFFDFEGSLQPALFGVASDAFYMVVGCRRQPAWPERLIVELELRDDGTPAVPALDYLWVNLFELLDRLVEQVNAFPTPQAAIHRGFHPPGGTLSVFSPGNEEMILRAKKSVQAAVSATRPFVAQLASAYATAAAKVSAVEESYALLVAKWTDRAESPSPAPSRPQSGASSPAYTSSANHASARYGASDDSVVSFFNDLRHAEQLVRRTSADQVCCGLVEVCCGEVKQRLLSRLERTRGLLVELINASLRKISKLVVDSCAKRTALLSMSDAAIGEARKICRASEEALKVVARYLAGECSEAFRIVTLCEKLQITVAAESFSAIATMTRDIMALRVKAGGCLSRIDSRKHEFAEEVDQQRAQVEELGKGLSKRLEELGDITTVEKCHIAVQICRDTRKLVNSLEEAIRGLVPMERFLAMEPMPLERVHHVKSRYELLEEFWFNLSDSLEIQVYYSTPLDRPGISAILHNVQVWRKRFRALSQFLHSHPSLQQLGEGQEARLGVFEAQATAMFPLTHPAITLSHWREVSRLLGLKGEKEISSVVSSGLFTLRFAIDIGILDRITDVWTVVNRAVADYSAHMRLEEMKSIAKRRRIVFEKEMSIPHAAAPLFANKVEITELLNHFAAESSLLRQRSDLDPKLTVAMLEWEGSIERMLHTVYEWGALERNWVKCRPVFLHVEARRLAGVSSQDDPDSFPLCAMADFKVVEESLRVISETSSRPQHTLYTLMMLDSLNELLSRAQASMDVILNRLGELLLMKRQGFPRLYLLTDEELLGCLTPVYQKELIAALRKMYPKLYTVEMAREQFSVGEAALRRHPPAAGGEADGDSRGKTTCVTAFVSKDYARLSCTVPCEVSNVPIDEWMSTFDAALRHSVYNGIMRCYRHYRFAPPDLWLRSHCMQMVRVSQRIMLWQDLVAALTIEGHKGLFSVLEQQKIFYRGYLEALALPLEVSERRGLLGALAFSSQAMKEVSAMIEEGVSTLGELDCFPVFTVVARDAKSTTESWSPMGRTQKSEALELLHRESHDDGDGRRRAPQQRVESAIQVRLLGASLNYGFEFLGNDVADFYPVEGPSRPSLGADPLKSASYGLKASSVRSLFMSAVASTPSIVYADHCGPSGEPDPINLLASLLGRVVIHIKCHSWMRWPHLSGIVRGLMLSGGWLCLEAVEQLHGPLADTLVNLLSVLRSSFFLRDGGEDRITSGEKDMASVCCNGDMEGAGDIRDWLENVTGCTGAGKAHYAPSLADFFMLARVTSPKPVRTGALSEVLPISRTLLHAFRPIAVPRCSFASVAHAQLARILASTEVRIEYLAVLARSVGSVFDAFSDVTPGLFTSRTLYITLQEFTRRVESVAPVECTPLALRQLLGASLITVFYEHIRQLGEESAHLFGSMVESTVVAARGECGDLFGKPSAAPPSAFAGVLNQKCLMHSLSISSGLTSGNRRLSAAEIGRKVGVELYDDPQSALRLEGIISQSPRLLVYGAGFSGKTFTVRSWARANGVALLAASARLTTAAMWYGSPSIAGGGVLARMVQWTRETSTEANRSSLQVAGLDMLRSGHQMHSGFSERETNGVPEMCRPSSTTHALLLEDIDGIEGAEWPLDLSCLGQAPFPAPAYGHSTVVGSEACGTASYYVTNSGAVLSLGGTAKILLTATSLNNVSPRVLASHPLLYLPPRAGWRSYLGSLMESPLLLGNRELVPDEFSRIATDIIEVLVEPLYSLATGRGHSIGSAWDRPMSSPEEDVSADGATSSDSEELLTATYRVVKLYLLWRQRLLEHRAAQASAVNEEFAVESSEPKGNENVYAEGMLSAARCAVFAVFWSLGWGSAASNPNSRNVPLQTCCPWGPADLAEAVQQVSAVALRYKVTQPIFPEESNVLNYFPMLNGWERLVPGPEKPHGELPLASAGAYGAPTGTPSDSSSQTFDSPPRGFGLEWSSLQCSSFQAGRSWEYFAPLPHQQRTMNVADILLWCGQPVMLIGPQESGKSSLLRMSHMNTNWRCYVTEATSYTRGTTDMQDRIRAWLGCPSFSGPLGGIQHRRRVVLCVDDVHLEFHSANDPHVTAAVPPPSLAGGAADVLSFFEQFGFMWSASHGPVHLGSHAAFLATADSRKYKFFPRAFLRSSIPVHVGTLTGRDAVNIAWDFFDRSECLQRLPAISRSVFALILGFQVAFALTKKPHALRTLPLNAEVPEPPETLATMTEDSLRLQVLPAIGTIPVTRASPQRAAPRALPNGETVSTLDCAAIARQVRDCITSVSSARQSGPIAVRPDAKAPVKSERLTLIEIGLGYRKSVYFNALNLALGLLTEHLTENGVLLLCLIALVEHYGGSLPAESERAVTCSLHALTEHMLDTSTTAALRKAGAFAVPQKLLAFRGRSGYAVLKAEEATRIAEVWIDSLNSNPTKRLGAGFPHDGSVADSSGRSAAVTVFPLSAATPNTVADTARLTSVVYAEQTYSSTWLRRHLVSLFGRLHQPHCHIALLSDSVFGIRHMLRSVCAVSGINLEMVTDSWCIPRDVSFSRWRRLLRRVLMTVAAAAIGAAEPTGTRAASSFRGSRVAEQLGRCRRVVLVVPESLLYRIPEVANDVSSLMTTGDCLHVFDKPSVKGLISAVRKQLAKKKEQGAMGRASMGFTSMTMVPSTEVSKSSDHAGASSAVCDAVHVAQIELCRRLRHGVSIVLHISSRDGEAVLKRYLPSCAKLFSLYYLSSDSQQEAWADESRPTSGISHLDEVVCNMTSSLVTDKLKVYSDAKSHEQHGSAEAGVLDPIATSQGSTTELDNTMMRCLDPVVVAESAKRIASSLSQCSRSTHWPSSVLDYVRVLCRLLSTAAPAVICGSNQVATAQQRWEMAQKAIAAQDDHFNTFSEELHSLRERLALLEKAMNKSRQALVACEEVLDQAKLALLAEQQTHQQLESKVTSLRSQREQFNDARVRFDEGKATLGQALLRLKKPPPEKHTVLLVQALFTALQVPIPVAHLDTVREAWKRGREIMADPLFAEKLTGCWQYETSASAAEQLSALVESLNRVNFAGYSRPMQMLAEWLVAVLSLRVSNQRIKSCTHELEARRSILADLSAQEEQAREAHSAADTHLSQCQRELSDALSRQAELRKIVASASSAGERLSRYAGAADRIAAFFSLQDVDAARRSAEHAVGNMYLLAAKYTVAPLFPSQAQAKEELQSIAGCVLDHAGIPASPNLYDPGEDGGTADVHALLMGQQGDIVEGSPLLPISQEERDVLAAMHHRLFEKWPLLTQASRELEDAVALQLVKMSGSVRKVSLLSHSVAAIEAAIREALSSGTGVLLCDAHIAGDVLYDILFSLAPLLLQLNHMRIYPAAASPSAQNSTVECMSVRRDANAHHRFDSSLTLEEGAMMFTFLGSDITVKTSFYLALVSRIRIDPELLVGGARRLSSLANMVTIVEVPTQKHHPSISPQIFSNQRARLLAVVLRASDRLGLNLRLDELSVAKEEQELASKMVHEYKTRARSLLSVTVEAIASEEALSNSVIDELESVTEILDKTQQSLKRKEHAVEKLSLELNAKWRGLGDVLYATALSLRRIHLACAKRGSEGLDDRELGTCGAFSLWSDEKLYSLISQLQEDAGAPVDKQRRRSEMSLQVELALRFVQYAIRCFRVGWPQQLRALFSFLVLVSAWRLSSLISVDKFRSSGKQQADDLHNAESEMEYNELLEEAATYRRCLPCFDCLDQNRLETLFSAALELIGECSGERSSQLLCPPQVGAVTEVAAPPSWPSRGGPRCPSSGSIEQQSCCSTGVAADGVPEAVPLLNVDVEAVYSTIVHQRHLMTSCTLASDLVEEFLSIEPAEAVLGFASGRLMTSSSQLSSGNSLDGSRRATGQSSLPRTASRTFSGSATRMASGGGRYSVDGSLVAHEHHSSHEAVLKDTAALTRIAVAQAVPLVVFAENPVEAVARVTRLAQLSRQSRCEPPVFVTAESSIEGTIHKLIHPQVPPPGGDEASSRWHIIGVDGSSFHLRLPARGNHRGGLCQSAPPVSSELQRTVPAALQWELPARSALEEDMEVTEARCLAKLLMQACHALKHSCTDEVGMPSSSGNTKPPNSCLWIVVDRRLRHRPHFAPLVAFLDHECFLVELDTPSFYDSVVHMVGSTDLLPAHFGETGTAASLQLSTTVQAASQLTDFPDSLQLLHPLWGNVSDPMCVVFNAGCGEPGATQRLGGGESGELLQFLWFACAIFTHLAVVRERHAPSGGAPTTTHVDTTLPTALNDKDGRVFMEIVRDSGRRVICDFRPKERYDEEGPRLYAFLCAALRKVHYLAQLVYPSRGDVGALIGSSDMSVHPSSEIMWRIHTSSTHAQASVNELLAALMSIHRLNFQREYSLVAVQKVACQWVRAVTKFGSSPGTESLYITTAPVNLRGAPQRPPTREKPLGELGMFMEVSGASDLPCLVVEYWAKVEREATARVCGQLRGAVGRCRASLTLGGSFHLAHCESSADEKITCFEANLGDLERINEAAVASVVRHLTGRAVAPWGEKLGGPDDPAEGSTRSLASDSVKRGESSNNTASESGELPIPAKGVDLLGLRYPRLFFAMFRGACAQRLNSAGSASKVDALLVFVVRVIRSSSSDDSQLPLSGHFGEAKALLTGPGGCVGCHCAGTDHSVELLHASLIESRVRMLSRSEGGETSSFSAVGASADSFHAAHSTYSTQSVVAKSAVSYSTPDASSMDSKLPQWLTVPEQCSLLLRAIPTRLDTPQISTCDVLDAHGCTAGGAAQVAAKQHHPRIAAPGDGECLIRAVRRYYSSASTGKVAPCPTCGLLTGCSEVLVSREPVSLSIRQCPWDERFQSLRVRRESVAEAHLLVEILDVERGAAWSRGSNVQTEAAATTQSVPTSAPSQPRVRTRVAWLPPALSYRIQIG